MKIPAAVGAIGVACLASTAHAGAMYDYSVTAYQDAARTELLFTVTAKVEDEIIYEYDDGLFSLFVDFDITDINVQNPLGETMDVDNLVYQQYSEGLVGEVEYGYGLSFSYIGEPFEMGGLFGSFTDVRTLQGYSNRQGTGSVDGDDIYTVASMVPVVPGPGVAMVVGLGGFAAGRGRRRR